MSTEADVIRCWLRGLFKTIENADDVEVKDFNFGPLEIFLYIIFGDIFCMTST